MARRLAKLLSFLTPKRRWLQFSLGTMLLTVTLLRCAWPIMSLPSASSNGN